MGGHGFGLEGPKVGPALWEAQIRSGLGEDSHETALVEIPLHGLVSESRPILLKGWLMGCEERPFYLKGSLVGCGGLSGIGFGLGLRGIKGDRAHSHYEVAEMEVRATEEASCTKVSEDEGVACFHGGDLRDLEVFSVNARAMMTDDALATEASRYDSFPAIFGGDWDIFSSTPSSGCDQALVVGGVSGSEGVDTVEGVGF